MRAERLAQLTATYPPIHWAVMSLLGGSILFGFLIESDQSQVQFLDAIQLRILFTMLAGAAAGTAVLCYDLSDPYRGSFTVARAADQFYSLRAAMDQTFCDVTAAPPGGDGGRPATGGADDVARR